MKEKIINYIETLEAKALQTDDYFKQRNDLYIENQQLHSIIKEVREYIETNSYFKDNSVKTIIFGDYSKGILEILEKENK